MTKPSRSIFHILPNPPQTSHRSADDPHSTQTTWLWVKNTGYLKNTRFGKRKNRPKPTSTPQQVVSGGFLIGKRLPKTTCWGVLVWPPRIFFLTHSGFLDAGWMLLATMLFPQSRALRERRSGLIFEDLRKT